MQTAPQPIPRLAPPGAGLPKPELLIAQIFFGLKRAVGNRDGFTAQFLRERGLIEQLILSVTPAARAQPILIARPRGLEDSSRNWSMVMTLDHLRIVHLEMSRIIGELSAGRTPAGRASTAAVKPQVQVADSVIADYEASCDALLTTVTAVPNLKTHTRFAHPWFGPLDAHGWYALAAGHLSIHRVQLERIIQGLTTTAGIKTNL
ncbi:MAG: hypothetical protein WCG63_00110 [Opitutaceae bacterium]